jgi:hypothetical protein
MPAGLELKSQAEGDAAVAGGVGGGDEADGIPAADGNIAAGGGAKLGQEQKEQKQQTHAGFIARKESKRFFFEKKNQKTFVNLASGVEPHWAK